MNQDRWLRSESKEGSVESSRCRLSSTHHKLFFSPPSKPLLQPRSPPRLAYYPRLLFLYYAYNLFLLSLLLDSSKSAQNETHASTLPPSLASFSDLRSSLICVSTRIGFAFGWDVSRMVLLVSRLFFGNFFSLGLAEVVFFRGGKDEGRPARRVQNRADLLYGLFRLFKVSETLGVLGPTSRWS